MKNIWFIIVVIVLSLLLLFFITNPDIVKNIWLWLIGFAGGIAGLFRNVFNKLSLLSKQADAEEFLPPSKSNKDKPNTEQIQNDTLKKVDTLLEKIDSADTIKNTTPAFDGTTLTVLRYSDDGETTLGLFYVRNQFFSYTLEDTYRENKIKNQTRIPAGTYDVDFLKTETGLTKKYRERFSWFDFHLEIKNIPNFHNVYIHIGNTHKDTAGCLLIADGINASSVKRTIVESTNAYKRFYLRMKDLLDNGEKLRIIIRDENWFKGTNLQ